MAIIGISNIKTIRYMSNEIKEANEFLKEKQYAETIDRRSKELALKLGTSPEHLDQSYPNYKQPELERMLKDKDVYRVLCGLVTGPFNEPRFSLKLEKINY